MRGLVKHHHSFKFLLAVFGLAGLVLAGLIAWAVLIDAAPNRVAANFTSDMLNGQTDQAYNLTAADFQTSTPKPDFAIFVQEFSSLPQQKPKQTKRQLGQAGGHQTAIITESIKDGSGKQILVTMTLVKYGKEWKVYNVQK